MLLFAALALIALTPLKLPPMFVAVPAPAPVSDTARLAASVLSFSVAARTLPVTLPPVPKFTVLPLSAPKFVQAIVPSLPAFAVVAFSV